MLSIFSPVYLYCIIYTRVFHNFIVFINYLLPHTKKLCNKPSYKFCKQPSSHTPCTQIRSKSVQSGVQHTSYLHLVGTVPFLPLLVKVVYGDLTDALWGLVGNDADAELANDLSRDDCLGSGLTECSLDAVQGEGWVAPACHQGLLLEI